MAFSTQTGYIVLQEYEVYCVGPATRQTHHKTMKQHNKTKSHKTLRLGLCGDNLPTA